MVYKFMWDATKWTGNFTVGLGKAIFSNKTIPTLPPKPDQLGRIPRNPVTMIEVVKIFHNTG